MHFSQIFAASFCDNILHEMIACRNRRWISLEDAGMMTEGVGEREARRVFRVVHRVATRPSPFKSPSHGHIITILSDGHPATRPPGHHKHTLVLKLPDRELSVRLALADVTCKVANGADHPHQVEPAAYQEVILIHARVCHHGVVTYVRNVCIQSRMTQPPCRPFIRRESP